MYLKANGEKMPLLRVYDKMIVSKISMIVLIYLIT